MKTKILVVFILSSMQMMAQQKVLPVFNEIGFFKSGQQMKWHYDNKKYFDKTTGDSIYNYECSLRPVNNYLTFVKEPGQINNSIDSVLLSVSDNSETVYRIISFELIYICRRCDPVVFSNEGNSLNAESLKAISNLHKGDQFVIRKVRAADNKTGTVMSMNSLKITF